MFGRSGRFGGVGDVGSVGGGSRGVGFGESGRSELGRSGVLRGELWLMQSSGRALRRRLAERDGLDPWDDGEEDGWGEDVPGPGAYGGFGEFGVASTSNPWIKRSFNARAGDRRGRGREVETFSASALATTTMTRRRKRVQWKSDPKGFRDTYIATLIQGREKKEEEEWGGGWGGEEEVEVERKKVERRKVERRRRKKKEVEVDVLEIEVEEEGGGGKGEVEKKKVERKRGVEVEKKRKKKEEEEEEEEEKKKKAGVENLDMEALKRELEEIGLLDEVVKKALDGGEYEGHGEKKKGVEEWLEEARMSRSLPPTPSKEGGDEEEEEEEEEVRRLREKLIAKGYDVGGGGSGEVGTSALVDKIASHSPPTPPPEPSKKASLALDAFLDATETPSKKPTPPPSPLPPSSSPSPSSTPPPLLPSLPPPPHPHPPSSSLEGIQNPLFTPMSVEQGGAGRGKEEVGEEKKEKKMKKEKKKRKKRKKEKKEGVEGVEGGGGLDERIAAALRKSKASM